MEQDTAANRAALGGKGRNEKLSPERRKEIARKAAKDRWEKSKASIKPAGQNSEFEPIILDENASKERILPVARWPGVLMLGAKEVPCYVLDDGRRIISRNAATGFLTNDRGGGNLENYLKVENL